MKIKLKTIFKILNVIQVLIAKGVQNNSPPLLQELFSDGLLNPKAP